MYKVFVYIFVLCVRASDESTRSRCLCEMFCISLMICFFFPYTSISLSPYASLFLSQLHIISHLWLGTFRRLLTISKNAHHITTDCNYIPQTVSILSFGSHRTYFYTNILFRMRKERTKKTHIFGPGIRERKKNVFFSVVVWAPMCLPYKPYMTWRDIDIVSKD